MKTWLSGIFANRRSPGILALVFSGALFAITGALLWFVYGSSLDTSRKEFFNDIRVAESNVRLSLDGNRDYLLLLAQELAKDAINETIFQEKVSPYVADHPELINITWAGSDYVIRTVAPIKGNQQIVGLTLSLPEPKRAADQARKTARPVYTRPFHAIQGKASFEIWVPVFRGREFVGLLAGVYSCNRLLAQTVPEEVLQKNHFVMLDDAGAVIAGLPAREAVDTNLSTSVKLAPPGNGVALVVKRYGPGIWARGMVLLGVLAMVLSLGTGYAIWLLTRELLGRRQALDSLRASEENFRSFAESAPQLIWMCRPDGENIYLNQRWVDYTGLTLEQSYGHGWSKPFHPEDQQRARDAWQHATGTGGTYDLECRLRRADGIYRWFLIRGLPLRDAAGHIVKWFGTCTDIDERKQFEEALLESRAKLAAALASMSDAVFIADTDGKFIEFNDAFVTFYRFKNRDTCGKRLSDSQALLDVFMADGEIAPHNMWAVPRALRGESATNVEYTLRRKDTGETWVGSYSFGPIRDKQGVIVGAVVVGRDITEPKRAQVRLNEQLLELRRWHEATLGREGRVMELKQEINELLLKTGQPIRYPSVMTAPEKAMIDA